MRQAEDGVWIIVPVYNAAKTLPRCLDSLLAQTFPAWEACLIDDGSTDDSWAVIRSYAEKDHRFAALASRCNGGPAAARNLGLAGARGQYVAFLDSDDWWEPDFLEQMLEAARRTGADFVQCGWTVEWPGGKSRPEPNTYPDFRVFDREAFGQPLAAMLGGISMNHVTRKLIRRQLLEGLNFPDGLVTAEDLAMSFQLLLRARRIAFLPRPLYHYYRHGGGLTGGKLGFGQKWAANRAVARMMQSQLRGTAFDTPTFRFLVWARPWRLILSKAVRLGRDQLYHRRKGGIEHGKPYKTCQNPFSAGGAEQALPGRLLCDRPCVGRGADLGPDPGPAE